MIKINRVKLVLFLKLGFYYIVDRELLNQSFLRELCMIYYLPRGLASAAEFFFISNSIFENRARVAYFWEKIGLKVSYKNRTYFEGHRVRIV